MKKYLFALLILASAGSGLTACKDQDKIPAPQTQDVALFFPQESTDSTKRFFKLDAAQFNDAQLAARGLTRPVYEFTIPAFNQRGIHVKAVEVYASFRRSAALFPPVLVGTYTTFPTTISFNSAEIVDKLTRLALTPGLTTNSLFKFKTSTGRYNVVTADAVVFTFEYIRDDDSHIVLTPRSYVKLTPGEALNPPGDSIAILNGNLTMYPYAAVAEFRNQ